MESNFTNSFKIPFLYCVNNIVTNVNNRFVKLTGYSKNEVVGKTLDEMNNLLKINFQIKLEDIEKKCNCYIFTKKHEAREVSIVCYNLSREDEIENRKVYFCEETINSKIKEEIPTASSVLEDNIMGTAICTAEGLILEINNCYLNFLNVSYTERENCLGKNIKDIINGHVENSLENILSKVKKTGKSYYVNEYKFTYHDGREKYYHFSNIPVFISESIKYIVSIVNDITERIENRELVEKQKNELEAVVENISDNIIMFDINGDYIMVNKEAREKLLCNNKEIKNIKSIFRQAVHYDKEGNILPIEKLPFQRVIRGEKFSENRLVIENENSTLYFEVSGTPIYDSFGNFTSGILVFRDISYRLKSEENMLIKNQYELVSRIINNLEFGLTRYSFPDYSIIDMNYKAYSQLKQIKVIDNNKCIEEKKFLKVPGIIDNSDEIYNKIADGNTYTNLIQVDTITGEKFFKNIYQPLYGYDNHIIEVIVVSMDVTEYLKDKNHLEEALKMQDELLVNVSHELKTPLNIIYSAIQLMEIYLKSGSIEDNLYKMFKSINSVKQNCYRLTKLINNIIDLSKIEAGNIKLCMSNENIVTVVECIVNSVSEYIKGKNLNVIFDANVNEKYITCDPEKIERVILNLISNAIKFTSPGDDIIVKVVDKNETVEILVIDTGIGIDESYLEKIFNRFGQVDKSLSRNAEGSGIGLSLVKSIVEMHDGKISVKSKVGEGSTFKIELPCKTNKTLNNANKIEMINIEFSDIYDNGWN